MRILTRLIFIAVVSWLGVILFIEGRKDYFAESTEQQTQAIFYFGGVVLIAVVVGMMVGLSLIPAIGDWIGHFFYNPNVEVERDPHMVAQSKVAQGDYEGAIEEYEAIFAENPGDTLSISEIAHIYCDRLENPEAAEERLSRALEGELPVEEAAFLTSRLVDVYWNYQKDAIRARQLLVQITEMLPDSKYAANAMHRLHEIDRALTEQELGMGSLNRPEAADESAANPAGEEESARPQA